MAKQMKTWNGYEVVDDSARKGIAELKSDVNGLTEAVANSGAIIDVVELPTENIREDCFYRLVSAKFVYNEEIYPNWIIQCVDEFPESPEPVSKDIVNIYAYYNTEDNDVYGYVDDFVSQAGGGIPTGWYTLQQLAPAFNLQWIGVITHIDDAKEDDSWKALLSYSFHIYKDGWKELPYAYESAPEFDIKWDGDMTDHMVLDMSALGYENLYYTKVSDIVLTVDELSGATVEVSDYNNNEIISTIINGGLTTENLFTIEDMFDGAIVVTDVYLNNNFIIVVHDADALATSLGIPTGIYSNGVYFWLNTDDGHISRLVSPKKVTKIDSKFVDIDMSVIDNLADVATTGSYNDLADKPIIYTDVIRYSVSQSLSSTNKSRARANIDVYSKSEVDTKIANNTGGVSESQVQSMIANAIGNAIGGSY